MGGTLAAGIDAVVTLKTPVHDCRMIDRRGNPLRGCMAGATVFCCRYVGCGLAAGDITVVTTLTGTNHLGVIHCRRGNRRPGDRSGLVAGITLVGGRHVGIRFAAGGGTVMTIETCTDDLVVF